MFVYMSLKRPEAKMAMICVNHIRKERGDLKEEWQCGKEGQIGGVIGVGGNFNWGWIGESWGVCEKERRGLSAR